MLGDFPYAEVLISLFPPVNEFSKLLLKISPISNSFPRRIAPEFELTGVL